VEEPRALAQASLDMVWAPASRQILIRMLDLHLRDTRPYLARNTPALRSIHSPRERKTMQCITESAIIKTGPYIGRVVELSPAAAVDALERCRLESGLRRSDESARWTILMAWGSLELRGAGDYPEPPRATHVWPLRRFKGLLRSRRGGYRVGVELELVPWSDERTELGLRPSGKWPPLFLRQLPYYRHGAAALDQLVREMTEWATVIQESAERVA
jgi:hypothetical protein